MGWTQVIHTRAGDIKQDQQEKKEQKSVTEYSKCYNKVDMKLGGEHIDMSTHFYDHVQSIFFKSPAASTAVDGYLKCHPPFVFTY